jgi:hypothetical protein
VFLPAGEERRADAHKTCLTVSDLTNINWAVYQPKQE